MLSRYRTIGTIALIAAMGLPLALLAQAPAASPAQPTVADVHQAPQSKSPQGEPGACPGCGHPHGQGAGMGPGRGPQGGGHMTGGGMGDPQHQADMETFHYLVDHGKEITRTVTQLPNGVDTLTESSNAEVAAKIKVHVASMTARVEDRRPIHRRDPLFAEIFAHADKIEMKSEPTPNGVRVLETSSDPYVAKLIQAHADVVTGFIKNGRSEMMKNHPVPER